MDFTKLLLHKMAPTTLLLNNQTYVRDLVNTFLENATDFYKVFESADSYKLILAKGELPIPGPNLAWQAAKSITGISTFDGVEIKKKLLTEEQNNKLHELTQRRDDKSISGIRIIF